LSANKTVIIGLTGGMGSGKSVVANVLVSLGATHVDADAISRSLTAKDGIALPAIREAFGDGVFNADGTLNRRALGDIVFADEGARHTLEGIIHPRVQCEALKQADAAKESGADAVILDVPLLFETGMDALCDVTWVIYADRETRVQRVMNRDGLSREQIEARIDNQMSDDERSTRATRVIENILSLDKLKSDVTNYYQQILRAFK